MDKKESYTSFSKYGRHKGFYNEKDAEAALCKVKYEDFFKCPATDDAPDTADLLLCGACNHFAISLKNVLGYRPYVIREINAKGFHAFCQVYKNGTWYYIDARGVTTNFDEFMKVASKFVRDEYIINPITLDMIAEWDANCNYSEEAYAFSEKVICKFKEYYMV